ncbi:MAG: flavin reductase family protein [Bacteroidetes bacterium]|nr:flavin reductase family protein [Bacteroidota bacterium]
MIKLDPALEPVPRIHQILLGSVAPRPIALASTVDTHGNPNLSPFSFFNVFGVNPTTLIFSPSRRGRVNTTKDTFENLKEVPEVVINSVNYAMVQQVNLASTEYPKGVNEFIKAGFTPLISEKVKPFRVKESPVQFECQVRQIIETGDKGGAGNLIICEILLIHLDENILSGNGMINPQKIDLVARMGADYYCRASGQAVFNVSKPLQKVGIGIDQLPSAIRNSRFLTGNDLGKLGNIEKLPDDDQILNCRAHNKEVVSGWDEAESKIARYAQKLLKENKVSEALTFLMSFL